MPSETASNRHREPRHGPPCSHPGETTQHHRTGRKASVIRLRHAPGPGGELKTAEIHCAARPNNGHLIALGCPHSFIPWARELVSKLGTLTSHQRTTTTPLSCLCSPPRTARRGIPFSPDAAFRVHRQSLLEDGSAVASMDGWRRTIVPEGHGTERQRQRDRADSVSALSCS